MCQTTSRKVTFVFGGFFLLFTFICSVAGIATCATFHTMVIMIIVAAIGCAWFALVRTMSVCCTSALTGRKGLAIEYVGLLLVAIAMVGAAIAAVVQSDMSPRPCGKLELLSISYCILAGSLATLLYAIFSIIALRCCVTFCLPNDGPEDNPALHLKGVVDPEAPPPTTAAPNTYPHTEPVGATTYQQYNDNPFASPPRNVAPNPFTGPGRSSPNPFAS